MRPIDADALTEILTTAIRNMEGIAKFIGCEDDPEFKMEIRAYRDILNGVKEQPTIEPKQREKGKWIEEDDGWDGVFWRCSECNEPFYLVDGTPVDNEYHYCPNCGADMRGEQDDKN